MYFIVLLQRQPINIFVIYAFINIEIFTTNMARNISVQLIFDIISMADML